MFSIFRKKSKPTVESTPLSEFVRKASSAKKKRVYVTALKRASETQNKVVARQKERGSDHSDSAHPDECLT
jgi:hypothetical protein